MINRIVRLLKHRWATDSRREVSQSMADRLTKKVAASEKKHNGDIRICIEAGLPNSYLLRKDSTRDLTRQRAVMQFGKLRVWDTEHNNGVLIYLLLAEQAIEVVADRGLNEVVKQQAWQAIVDRLAGGLRAGQFEAALNQVLGEVTLLLETHFPHRGQERKNNDLPDSPVLL